MVEIEDKKKHWWTEKSKHVLNLTLTFLILDESLLESDDFFGFSKSEAPINSDWKKIHLCGDDMAKVYWIDVSLKKILRAQKTGGKVSSKVFRILSEWLLWWLFDCFTWQLSRQAAFPTLSRPTSMAPAWRTWSVTSPAPAAWPCNRAHRRRRRRGWCGATCAGGSCCGAARSPGRRTRRSWWKATAFSTKLGGEKNKRTGEYVSFGLICVW